MDRDRNRILHKLRERLEPLRYVRAMWLEGADAIGTADEYSDIDINVDVLDEFEQQSYEAVERLLGELGTVDFLHIDDHPHPKLRQRVYHLAGTSEYLLIDFNWQMHSRDQTEGVFIRGNKAEAALVLFDKDGVVRWKDYDPADFINEHKTLLTEYQYRYSQHVRVEKYIRRGTYLEAYAYYNRYVVEPLVGLLRMVYTPASVYNYLLHISQQVPKAESDRLLSFTQLTSLEDMQRKLPLAAAWFAELCERPEIVRLQ